jgi:hypothetical protein
MQRALGSARQGASNREKQRDINVAREDYRQALAHASGAPSRTRVRVVIGRRAPSHACCAAAEAQCRRGAARHGMAWHGTARHANGAERSGWARPWQVAVRAAVMYSVISQMRQVSNMYLTSLADFDAQFQRAIRAAEPTRIKPKRVAAIVQVRRCAARTTGRKLKGARVRSGARQYAFEAG